MVSQIYKDMSPTKRVELLGAREQLGNPAEAFASFDLSNLLIISGNAESPAASFLQPLRREREALDLSTTEAAWKKELLGTPIVARAFVYNNGAHPDMPVQAPGIGHGYNHLLALTADE